MPPIEELLIVSHVAHFRHANRLYAYAPYAREIDIWADLFPRVRIAAPCRLGEPDADCVPFTRSNIDLIPQRETGGTTWGAKFGQFLAVPQMIFDLAKAMNKAEAIHVRCPGNLGLLGAFLAPCYSRYLVAKYTGQWNGFPGEPFTWKLQRFLLSSRWWRGPVTIYGEWPNQSPKIVPLFTSVMTDEQMKRARRSAENRTIKDSIRILFVGRLSPGKNIDVLLRALANLKARGLHATCRIVGEGPERANLESLAANLNIQDRAEFVGGLDFDGVLNCYETSDVLVLASQTESWGKSLTEAMAFGLICIASDRGLMPKMLADGRGFVVPPRDLDSLTEILRKIAESPHSFAEVSARAAGWGQRYSLENLREAFRSVLAKHWDVPVSIVPRMIDSMQGV